MKVGLYPGCSLEASSREYLESLRAIAPALNLELEEVQNWNCCGASSAHAMDHILALSLPAETLAQAEQQSMKELMVPCAACYGRLAATKAELAENPTLKQQISERIEMPYTGSTEILTILDILDKVLTADVVKSFPKKFSHRVVCYYGCLLVRPPKITKAQRVEDPLMMEELLKRIGAQPLDWGMKTECCGASFSITRTDLVGMMSGKIIEDAISRGAEAIIVACPMCQSNLDMRRQAIEKAMGKRYSIPVLFITQAIGLALGLDSSALGLKRHFVPVSILENQEAKSVAAGKSS
ncbi:MAG: CoB--CoM heterodisulfide reductase iron-sulfur subunit B family protein [Bacteroidetes bacterium]|nr:CoB--CoM heterodisulfide reductase iron-sulfur subunit B family protein [Bacteroidota bacterium]